MPQSDLDRVLASRNEQEAKVESLIKKRELPEETEEERLLRLKHREEAKQRLKDKYCYDVDMLEGSERHLIAKKVQIDDFSEREILEITTCTHRNPNMKSKNYGQIVDCKVKHAQQ